MWTNRVYVFLCDCEVAEHGITATMRAQMTFGVWCYLASTPAVDVRMDARKSSCEWSCMCLCIGFWRCVRGMAFSLSVYFFRHIIHTPVFVGYDTYLRGGKCLCIALFISTYWCTETLESPFEYIRFAKTQKKQHSSWMVKCLQLCDSLYRHLPSEPRFDTSERQPLCAHRTNCSTQFHFVELSLSGVLCPHSFEYLFGNGFCFTAEIRIRKAH